MFGMGMTEILVILVVAMLFLGPDKLPEAAKTISKGIRDLRKQTREFTDTIENDTEIGGAIRDIKSALRGEEIRRPPVRKVPIAPGPVDPVTGAALAAGPTADGVPADGTRVPDGIRMADAIASAVAAAAPEAAAAETPTPPDAPEARDLSDAPWRRRRS